MVRTRLNIGCRYSTPVLERPLHPTRSQFKPQPSQTQAPVTPATEPERRAGGGLTTLTSSIPSTCGEAFPSITTIRPRAPRRRPHPLPVARSSSSRVPSVSAYLLVPLLTIVPFVRREPRPQGFGRKGGLVTGLGQAQGPGRRKGPLRAPMASRGCQRHVMARGLRRPPAVVVWCATVWHGVRHKDQAQSSAAILGSR